MNLLDCLELFKQIIKTKQSTFVHGDVLPYLRYRIRQNNDYQDDLLFYEFQDLAYNALSSLGLQSFHRFSQQMVISDDQLYHTIDKWIANKAFL